LLLREVSDGTLDETSESLSSSLELSPSESLTRAAANLAESSSTVGCLNFSVVICRVACGFVGFGLWICEGDSERPLTTFAVLMRRCCRADLELGGSAPGRAAGMSSVFNFRPVVGSVTDSRAGSCDTWYPSMM